jgi:hypothetical protein
MWIKNTLIRPDDDAPGEWNPPEIPGKIEWSDNSKAQVSGEDGIALTTNYPHVVDAADADDDADGDENDAQTGADTDGDGGAGDDAEDDRDGNSDESPDDTGEVVASESITVEPEGDADAEDDADADSDDETGSNIDTDSNIQTDTDNEDT